MSLYYFDKKKTTEELTDTPDVEGLRMHHPVQL